MSSETQYDYDLICIGAGSGGVRASRFAATYGARVAVVEERALGGTCVNVGCIPKKLFAYGAHISEEIEDAKAFGWDLECTALSWPRLVANKNAEIERLNGIYRRLLDSSGVTILEGRGTLLDRHTVEVAGRRYTTRYLLIATGGWPFVPDIEGAEHGITSNEAFYLPELPKRIVVGGGGYIATEFASIFHGYGAAVTQLYRGPLFMRGFDHDVRAVLAEEMSKKGIRLAFNSQPKRIEKRSDCLHITLEDDTVLEADLLMLATGRVPNTAGLGLEQLGVERNWRGEIVVDAACRTSVENIYAVGDVIGGMQLTPVALAEGMAVAKTLFGGERTEVDYTHIATAVFCNPNVGTVGYTEEEAREHCGPVDIYKSSFTPLKHTLTHRGEKTFMKLIVQKSTDRVVGLHMVGPDAGEILQGFAVALKAGATKAIFDSTIGIHPTAAEEYVTLRTPTVPADQADAAD